MIQGSRTPRIFSPSDDEHAQDCEAEVPLIPCTGDAILVVDDEDGIRRLFQIILQSSLPDTNIDLASNGSEAVERFRVTHHSVVLMDIQMPVMDGRAAFSEIASVCDRNRWKMPSVVFCTGFAPPAAVQSIVDSNNLHCLLTKPVSIADLVGAVSERLAY